MSQISKREFHEMEMNPKQKLQIPKYLFLSSYHSENECHFLRFEAGTRVFSLKLSEDNLRVFCQFVDPVSLYDISLRLNKPLNLIDKFCKGLFQKGLIVNFYEDSKDSKYSRHMLYYELNNLNPLNCQKRLRNLQVVLVGMGGIGNWISLNLIGLGLKKIRIIDPDDIEKSNLTRQVLFTENDIGKSKVLKAKDELNKRNSDTEIDAIYETVSESNLGLLVKGFDFAVLSADSPAYLIQRWMNKACWENKVPFFNVGYSGGIGVIGPLVVPGKTGCLACQQKNKNILDLKINPEVNSFLQHYQTPSFVSLNSTISSLASYEIIKFMLSFGHLESFENQIQFNPINFQIKKIPFSRKKGCEVCDK